MNATTKVEKRTRIKGESYMERASLLRALAFAEQKEGKKRKIKIQPRKKKKEKKRKRQEVRRNTEEERGPATSDLLGSRR